MEEKPTNPERQPWLTKNEWLVAIVGAILAPVGQAAFDAVAVGVRSIPLSGASAVVAGLIARVVESLWAVVPAAFVFIVLRRHLRSEDQRLLEGQKSVLFAAADAIEARLKALAARVPELDLLKAEFALAQKRIELHTGDLQRLSQDNALLGPMRELGAMLLDRGADKESWKEFPGSLPTEKHNAIILGCHFGVFEIRRVGERLEWRKAPIKA